jgi:hypothetical protein
MDLPSDETEKVNQPKFSEKLFHSPDLMGGLVAVLVGIKVGCGVDVGMDVRVASGFSVGGGGEIFAGPQPDERIISDASSRRTIKFEFNE